MIMVQSFDENPTVVWRLLRENADKYYDKKSKFICPEVFTVYKFHKMWN
jgi:hypothetical protein